MEPKAPTHFWKKSTKIITGLALTTLILGSGYSYVTATSSKAEANVSKNYETPHSKKSASKNNASIISTISSQKAESSAIASSQLASQKASEASSNKAKQEAEEASANAQSAFQAQSEENTNTSKVESASSTTTQAQTTTQNNTQQSQVASTDTSGFNFAGYHFPIASFSGTGQVPATHYVYQWTSDSRWFLIEQGGDAGHVIKANVHMGTAVTVNGRTYHVTDLVGGIPNDGTAGAYYQSHIGQHAIGFQTCDYVGVLTLYFAD